MYYYYYVSLLLCMNVNISITSSISLTHVFLAKQVPTSIITSVNTADCTIGQMFNVTK